MDLDKCLCRILQNSTLKLVAIFFSSSQIIGGTNQLYHTFVSLLEENEDEEEKWDREGNEDSETGGGILTFKTERVAIFFFWARGRITELEVGD